MDNFCDRLKLARKRKGTTQKEVASYLSISEDMYRGYEAGRNDPPLRRLCLLADYFDVSADYLLGRLDEPSTATQTDATTQD